jgi:hypothetical protein
MIVPAEDPCRILIDGVEHLYVSSNNLTSESLEVPLTYNSLNQILSVTGGAAPPTLFAPGTSGFSLALSNFLSGSTITGQWKFLGQTISFGSDLQVCGDRGVPGQCEALSPTVLTSPFDYTRRTILNLTNQSLAAARSGRWRSTNGKFSVPFLSRGAKALAEMNRALQNASGQAYVCEVVPMSCTIRRVPKKELSKAFAKIFVGRVPRGLEHISRRSKKEIAGFNRFMKKLPDTYVTCD